MTEKGGGSDVSNATQTVAVHEGDNLYRLYGYKWFSSATDSDVSITLARVMKDGVPSAKLSMFLLRVRREDGSLNHIRIMNMKDKLGTR
jgi:alkylation response protein AidB-like acyl-CoA dehydrogenase